MKKSSIELRPSRKNDTMRFRVRETVEKLQKDEEYRKRCMNIYEGINSFDDCIDVLTKNVWISFVIEDFLLLKPSAMMIGFAWYYGMKEGIFKKDVPYDQVVFLIRRKVIFRLTEVQENFNL